MHCPWIFALAVRQIESAKQRSKNRKQRVRSRPVLESLEQRCVLIASATITSFGNIAAPTRGQAGIDLVRVSPASYAERISASSQPMARMEAVPEEVMGACFFSDGTCAELTEGTCEAVGGISWVAGAPCPCPEPQVTDPQESTSDMLTEMISGGEQAPPRSHSTATSFALLAGARVAGMFAQSNLGVPSTPPVAAQTPIMMITDTGPQPLPVGGAVRSIVSAAETANLDAFWRQYGANDGRSVSLGSLDSGAADYSGL
jgi:hypothetical protein